MYDLLYLYINLKSILHVYDIGSRSDFHVRSDKVLDLEENEVKGGY